MNFWEKIKKCGKKREKLEKRRKKRMKESEFKTKQRINSKRIKKLNLQNK
jgi:hypothetical protein